jgi:hypothetical protein
MTLTRFAEHFKPKLQKTLGNPIRHREYLAGLKHTRSELRTQVSVMSNACWRVNGLHIAGTAPQGRMFGVATAWMDTTVKACGWASGGAQISRISLGNPIIRWLRWPDNFTRRRLPAERTTHLV